MFTGIIEEIGTIKQIRKNTNSILLEIEAKKMLEDISIGDSICTNGVCLTVVDFTKSFFTADVMNETLKVSNLSNLVNGSLVNLERAVQLSTRMGGHLVSGHIDGIGEIIELKNEGIAQLFRVKTSEEVLKYLIKKGSIAVDGISLTIQYLDATSFQISIIPHTQKQSNLYIKKVGDKVNLEVDMLAKYVERLINYGQASEPKKDLNMNNLIKQGFIS